jgi:hypothetical protein
MRELIKELTFMKFKIMLLTLTLALSCGAQSSDNSQRGGRGEAITPPTPQQLLLARAVHDWKAGAHLPFMPNLNRPVHIRKGAWVCNSGGELLNPNKLALMWLHECLQSPKDVHIIGVMEPLGINEEEYVADHMTGTVQIVYRSREQSDANVYTAWVFVKSLSN